jgi:hypothetical protein
LARHRSEWRVGKEKDARISRVGWQRSWRGAGTSAERAGQKTREFSIFNLEAEVVCGAELQVPSGHLKGGANSRDWVATVSVQRKSKFQAGRKEGKRRAKSRIRLATLFSDAQEQVSGGHLKGAASREFGFEQRQNLQQARKPRSLRSSAPISTKNPFSRIHFRVSNPVQEGENSRKSLLHHRMTLASSTIFILSASRPMSGCLSLREHCIHTILFPDDIIIFIFIYNRIWSM